MRLEKLMGKSEVVYQVFVSLLLFILCVVPTNLVVKSEGGIVDEASFELHVAAEPAKEAQHFET